MSDHPETEYSWKLPEPSPSEEPASGDLSGPSSPKMGVSSQLDMSVHHLEQAIASMRAARLALTMDVPEPSTLKLTLLRLQRDMAYQQRQVQSILLSLRVMNVPSSSSMRELNDSSTRSTTGTSEDSPSWNELD